MNRRQSLVYSSASAASLILRRTDVSGQTTDKEALSGVTVTWPLAYKVEGFKRDTFTDWAREILEMKKRLGIEHVALGTDGGGQLPRLISGYRDVCDL